MNIRKDAAEHQKNTREDMDRRWKIVREAREARLAKKEIAECQAKNGPVPNKPEDELTQLAKDIHGNLVFTDRHVRNPHDLTSVFMLMMLVDPRQMPVINSIGMVYEYLSQAGPMAVNGNPTFFSMKMLSKHDTEIVWKKVAKIESLMADL